jgi:hypothetical protein
MMGNISKRKINKTRKNIFQGSQLLYIILVTFFGAFFFTIPYLLYLATLPHDITLFGYILLWNIIAGICAGIMARLLSFYGHGIFKTAQTVTKNLLNSFIYSLLIFFGLIQYLFQHYNVSFSTSWAFIQYLGTSAFWELVAFLGVLKLMVYLLSDFISDKLTFGPS